MENLSAFSLPIGGLRTGTHRFEFTLDREFFAQIPDSIVSDGDVKAIVELDKQATMYILEFDLEGTVRTDCDRCLQPFDLPIDVQQRLTLKFGEGPEDADVEYIQRDESRFNVAPFCYEFTVLDIPMSKTHDDADQDCDPEMIEHLERASSQTDTDEGGSVWDALKDLNNND